MPASLEISSGDSTPWRDAAGADSEVAPQCRARNHTDVCGIDHRADQGSAQAVAPALAYYGRTCRYHLPPRVYTLERWQFWLAFHRPAARHAPLDLHALPKGLELHFIRSHQSSTPLRGREAIEGMSSQWAKIVERGMLLPREGRRGNSAVRPHQEARLGGENRQGWTSY